MNVRRITVLLLVTFAFLTQAFAASPNVVISQVFPGGASGGAAYTHDYVELFNTSDAAVPLTGWSLQYGSSTGQFGSTAATIFSFPAGTTIAANKYLLVRLGGTTTGAATFTSDLTGSIGMAAASGKVALVTQTGTLGCGATATPCALPHPQIVDVVSWGASNNAEGGVTVNNGVGLTSAFGMIRKQDGCTDTDSNFGDFLVANIAAGLVPRNSGSPAKFCTAVNSPPSIASIANPYASVNVNAAPFSVSLSGSDDDNVYNWSATAGSGITSVVVSAGQGTANATFNVTLQSGFTGTASFTAVLSDGVNAPATRAVNIAVNSANNVPSINTPANPIATVEQDAAPFSVVLTGSDDNAVYNWSAMPGTGVSFVNVASGQGTATATFNVALQAGFNGAATFTAQLSDNVNATVVQTVNITVNAPIPPPDHVVISQVYGGGGNSSATFTHDFVELYNPTQTTFNLAGWTIQYQAATSTGTWANIQPLGGLIAPGEYYLISLGTNGNVGSSLPLPNVDGSLNLSGTTGKVALVSNGDALSGCPLSDSDLVDFVGYGTTANCREGSGNAPAPSNQNSVFRKLGGAQDTNVNSADFVAAIASPRRTAPIMETGPFVTSTDPTTSDTNIPRDGSILVNFSEAVTFDAGFYDITCASTGSHNSATVASIFGATGLLITPNVNFAAGEQCTVTIFGNAIHDVDLDDANAGTDTMFSNRVWSFTVASGAAPAYPADVHLTFGNPTDAEADLLTPNNYLMVKPELALSYNRDRGTANWVSWHLSNEWTGTLSRVDTFRPDPQVPAEWYRVLTSDYSNSGFDRGHMVPNADRNVVSIPINQATFLMTNIIPQSPDNNQGPWADMENDLRALLPANELYIVAGGAGTGGSGNNGFATTIAGGKIAVPASTWKVVLVIPKNSGDDVAAVTAATRTIAVLMPNVQGIRNDNWLNYLTTVDAIESLTGYDFFENLPDAIENAVEAGINGVNPPGAANATASTSEDTARAITLDGAGNGSLTYNVVNGPAHGTVTISGNTATYTPAPDYFGNDAFSFNVTSGSSTSNTATVSLFVSEVNDAPVAANDALNAVEDTPLTFAASTLTANDVAGPANESSQTLTVTSVSGATLAGGMVTFTPAANFNGVATLSYQVCDDGVTNGLIASLCATATLSINVAAVNDAPAVTVAAPASVSEGTAVTATASVTDVDDTVFSYAWSVTKNGAPFATSPNFTPDDDGTYVVTVTVTDAQGGTGSASTSVTVTNVAPAIVSVTGPNSAIALGTAATITVNVLDAGAADTHTAFFTWDDGSSSTAACAAGVCTGSRTYAANGIYTVAITVADDDGGAASTTFASVVVFDVNAPAVTGGGTFQANGSRVQFTLNAKYDNNGNLSGTTQFGISGITGDSKTLWLVVNGNTATLKGTIGTNTFLATVTDGPDTIRLQIWDAANNVVFDNGSPSNVNGQITIHKK